MGESVAKVNVAGWMGQYICPPPYRSLTRNLHHIHTLLR